MKLPVWQQRLTTFDRKVILVLVGLVCLSFLLPLQQGRGKQVLVSSGEKTIYTANLRQDQLVDLSGPLGITVLEISNGAAQILSSPCPKKICIGLGKARHSGDLLACVPNQLVIRISGHPETSKNYDLLSH